MPTPESANATIDYRLAPMYVARVVGSAFVLFAVVMFAATALVAALDLPGDLLTALLVLCLVGIGVLAWWLRSKAYVIRFLDSGYRVGLVWGAGVRQAAWREVTEAVVSTEVGSRMELHLGEGTGRVTVIPMDALEVSPGSFTTELQKRLHLGHGGGRARSDS